MTKYYVYMLRVKVYKTSGKWRTGYGPHSKRRCGMYGRDEFFYVGMTGNVNKRLEEHKLGIRSNFIRSFDVQSIDLVYVEQTGEDYQKTLKREKQIKRYSKKKKEELINEHTQNDRKKEKNIR